MPLDRLINILVTVTLIEMMVLIGLRVTFAEIANTARSWPLIARAVAANYLLVPVLAIVLLILFAANPMVAVGFLVLAVCPGAPYGPPFAGIARANVPEAVGLMVILAGSSAFVSPLLLQVLLPLVASGEAARIDPFGMMSALLITQLLPLLLGLLLRHRRPQLAERLLGPFELATQPGSPRAIELLVHAETKLARFPVSSSRQEIWRNHTGKAAGRDQAPVGPQCDGQS